VPSEGQPAQSDRAAQLAAARLRAVEVRKQRAKEKGELKLQEKENERLRLEKVKQENEKLKKSIEGDKEEPSPKRAKVEESDNGSKPTEGDGPRQQPTVDTVPAEPVAPAPAKSEDASNSHILQVAEKINALETLFREEMEYKKRKRADKEQEEKKQNEARQARANAIHHDPTYVAYNNGMKKTRDSVFMSHVFGN